MHSSCTFFYKKVYEYRHNLSFFNYNMNMNCAMEKEINSQGLIIKNLIDKYIKNYCILMDLPLLIRRITLVASGSSYNAALCAKYFFENISLLPVSVEYASEFANVKKESIDSDSLFIFISQSGSSADTLKCMQKVKKTRGKTICITNNENSIMYNLADYKFNIEAGKEEAIAATKTFSATVFMLWIIACKIAQNKHIDITEETKNINAIPKSIEETLENIDNLNFAAKFLSKQKDFSSVGFGAFYPVAREAALKIQETSYINISSYPTGEYIHGHFALLNKSKVFLTFMTKDATEEELKLLGKILKTYKTKAVVISDVYEDYDCEMLIKIPNSPSRIAAIINTIIAIQFLALKIAFILKRDVDKPKGLNKVVDGKDL